MPTAGACVLAPLCHAEERRASLPLDGKTFITILPILLIRVLSLSEVYIRDMAFREKE